MKVIDLLNKIAKGEELPKKISYRGNIYDLVHKNTIQGSYDYEYTGKYLIEYMISQRYLSDLVNEEIEIIEEKEIKKLDKSKFYDNKFPDEWEEELINKIDEIIDELNKIKKEGK